MAPARYLNCGQSAAGQIVEIEPGTITGYYVHLCPFIDALLAGRQALA